MWQIQQGRKGLSSPAMHYSRFCCRAVNGTIHTMDRKVSQDMMSFSLELYGRLRGHWYTKFNH